MDLKSQRRMAAEMLKCGENRVRITQSKDVEEALTRADVRRLIVKGFIYKAQVKGKVRAGAKNVLKQKSKGRRGGRGSRKGAKGARQGRKDLWMKRVRALRRTLRGLRDSGKISVKDYRNLYLMVKGNSFRNKRHLLSYLKEQEILKGKETKAKKVVKKKVVKKKVFVKKKAARVSKKASAKKMKEKGAKKKSVKKAAKPKASKKAKLLKKPAKAKKGGRK